MTTVYDTKGLGVINFDAEKGNTDMYSLEIGDQAKYIEAEAFKGCTSLAECDIPQSVQGIGGSAFTGTIAPLVINCPNLTLLYALSATNVERVINLGNLATIAEKCFYQCHNLKSLILPASLTTRIQAYAFMDCTSLEYVICHMVTPTPSYRDIFTNTNDCPIYVPDASVDAYKAASVWSGYASRIKPLSKFNG